MEYFRSKDIEIVVFCFEGIIIESVQSDEQVQFSLTTGDNVCDNVPSLTFKMV